MNLTVSELLTVVGRLDDAPGPDTPRERFRRFLAERIVDVPSARTVIHECRQTLGEQHQRAMQDAIVLTGKLLGFLTTFGPYQHQPGTGWMAGQWESRRRLHVTLTLCAGQMPAADLDAFARTVRSERTPRATDVPRVGLCVTTPTCATRSRLEEAIRSRRHPDLRLMTLDGLLHMADMVAAGQLTHDTVLQVLNPDADLDSFLGLLDRPTSAPSSPIDRPDAPAPHVPQTSPTKAFWLALVQLPGDTPAAQFVDAVLAKRRLLGVTPESQVERAISPGDSIRVCITGEGCVADAEVEQLVTDASATVRDAERFAQVLRLTAVNVYPRPIAATPDLVRRLEATLDGHTGAIATSISREEFEVVVRAAAADNP
jgi:hypothetical protein